MYTNKLEKNTTLTKQIMEGLKNTRKHKLIIIIIYELDLGMDFIDHRRKENSTKDLVSF